MRRELSTLSKRAAEHVAKHLVAAAEFLDEDPERALAHASAARKYGARLAVVRETVGYAAYAAGNYEQALGELRAARRLNGSNDYLPVLADCERGLGRPERALELTSSKEGKTLDKAGQIELRIVEAGARRDLGEPEAALRALTISDLESKSTAPWVARLRYTYADTLAALDRLDEAATWFARAAVADEEGQTDAADRHAALTNPPEPTDLTATAPAGDDGADAMDPTESTSTGDSVDPVDSVTIADRADAADSASPEVGIDPPDSASGATDLSDDPATEASPSATGDAAAADVASESSTSSTDGADAADSASHEVGIDPPDSASGATELSDDPATDASPSAAGDAAAADVASEASTRSDDEVADDQRVVPPAMFSHPDADPLRPESESS